MMFSSDPRAKRRLVSIIARTVILGVFFIALHPRIADPFGEGVPLREDRLGTVRDFIQPVAHKLGSKLHDGQNQETFLGTATAVSIRAQRTSFIEARPTQANYQSPSVGSPSIRAPPLLVSF